MYLRILIVAMMIMLVVLVVNTCVSKNTEPVDPGELAVIGEEYEAKSFKHDHRTVLEENMNRGQNDRS